MLTIHSQNKASFKNWNQEADVMPDSAATADYPFSILNSQQS